MATTRINSVKSTLNLSISYILDPEKTKDGLFTDSYCCALDATQAAEEFLSVRKRGTGRGSVLAQHIRQSFNGYEVTPEQALKLGIELADKLLKGKYQYVIATHVNTKNIHNHIIFNNISFDNYKSFEYNENRGKKSYDNLRKISDEICRENGLTLIENPQMGKGKCYYEWQQDCLGKSWKSKLRYAIDQTIMESSTFEDFLRNIKAKNIECVYRSDNVIKIKFRMPGQERFSRGKTLGWYYDEPQIRKRIEQYQFIKTGVSGKTVRTKIIDTNTEIFQTEKGLLHWAEIENMKEASRLINFLTTHNLQSETELNNAATETYNKRMVLVGKLNQTQSKIQQLNDEIKMLRTYKKYKPYADGLKQASSKRRYEKDNAAELEKYRSIVAELKMYYPNNVLPNLERLERERSELIADVKTMNEEYRKIVNELKEIEYAQQSIQEYVKGIDGSRKNSHEL